MGTVDLGGKGKFSVHEGAEHRALGVPVGQKIPAAKHAAAARSKNPHIRAMEASAKGFSAMHHPKTSKGFGGKVFQE